MRRVDVFGGVYGERCAFPHWNQVFGSAGRAAIGLSSLFDEVHLHTFLAADEAPSVNALFQSFGVSVHDTTRPHRIVFEYLHSLSTPSIIPSRATIAKVAGSSAEVDTAIYFGALEGSSIVSARHCVYDPQSTYNPMFFKDTGSTAEHLAVILNAGEARKLSGETDVAAAAKKIMEHDAAEIVIIKNGLYGARYFTKDTSGSKPAYKAKNVFSIGSGDVFVASFAYGWTVGQLSLADAVDFASKATAAYVESQSLPIITPEEASARSWSPAAPTGGKIYLAGPFRELGQRFMINDAREHLGRLGMKVFSPIHDIGPGPAEEVVASDLRAIQECDAVFAFLNGSSPGTVFEVGYATGLERPVFCVAQNMRQADLKLPIGSGCFVHDDYVSALFHVAWRD